MDPRKPVSLNLNVRGMGVSATLAISEKCKRLEAGGRNIHNFGLGQSPFPVPEPVVNRLKLHAHEKEYLPVHGLPALREAVAHFHRNKDNVGMNADNILIGPGSKELLFLLQLVYYGEIIVPTPCWVSYVPQAQIIGRNVRLVHSSFERRWHVPHESLVELFENDNDKYRPRLLVLNYPSNPHGGTYSSDELKRIADLARSYQMIVLSDEIYGQLHHKGEHVSIARFYPEGTIISSGLSKWCGAGGWRLGTFAFPPELTWLMDSMAAVASETYTSVSAPIQFAAVAAFQGGMDLERYLWHVRRILAKLGGYCTRALTEAGVNVQPPVGAFYLFLDFTPFSERLARKGITTSGELCDAILEQAGVAILPGIVFERPADELTARLSYVNFDGPKALAASETIPLDQPLPDDFLHTHCRKTLLGIERIVEWLRAI